MAFKMKGNPYKMGKMATKSALKQTQQPYSGTTDSPTRQFEPGDYYDTRSKSPNKQFEPGDYYDTKTDERKLPMDMKSPAKAHKKGHDDITSPTDPNSPTKMKDGSPMKDSGTAQFPDQPEKTQRGHDKAYGKGHPDSYHEMGQNPTPEEKKAFLDAQKKKSPVEMNKSSYKMGGTKKKDTMAYMKSPLEAAKPDYPDIDGDDDTTESMKKAAADMKSS